MLKVLGLVISAIFALVAVFFLQINAEASYTYYSPLSPVPEPQSICDQVKVTPYSSYFYGYVRSFGSFAPKGVVVTAKNSQGNVVGCQVVQEEGVMPILAVFGKDDLETPGMNEGEEISFFIND